MSLIAPVSSALPPHRSLGRSSGARTLQAGRWSRREDLTSEFNSPSEQRTPSKAAASGSWDEMTQS